MVGKRMKVATLGIVVAFAAGAAHAAPGFRDVTASMGIPWRNVNGGPGQIPLLDQNGQGIAVLDFDEDGWFDLFLVNGSTLPDLAAGRPPAPPALLRNEGDGTYRDVTTTSGVVCPRWAIGAAAADIDQDGYTDLHVTAYGPDFVLHNQGDGTFALVDDAWGGDDPGWSSGASFGDVDGDGDLDLAVGNYVQFDPAIIPDTEEDGGPCLYKGQITGCGPWRWRGQGIELYRNDGGRFRRATEAAGLSLHSGARCFQPLLQDLDGDHDLDLYVGTDVMPNICMENRGDGTFVTNTAWGGQVAADGKQRSSMGLTAGDVDGDGRPDLFMTNFSDEDDTLFMNRRAPPHFEDVTSVAGLGTHRGELGWGATLSDLDLDGHLDVFLVNGHIYPQVEALGDPLDSYAQLPRFHRGHGDGTFSEAGEEELEGLRTPARALAVLDRDNDGDLDLVIGVHNGKPRFLDNAHAGSPGAGRGILLDLVGTRSNRESIATFVTGKSEGHGRTQHRWATPHQGFQGTQDSRLHMTGREGVGDFRIEVRWPSGTSQAIDIPAHGVVTRIIEN